MQILMYLPLFQVRAVIGYPATGQVTRNDSPATAVIVPIGLTWGGPGNIDKHDD